LVATKGLGLLAQNGVAPQNLIKCTELNCKFKNYSAAEKMRLELAGTPA
jgi:hypothetical protein